MKKILILFIPATILLYSCSNYIKITKVGTRFKLIKNPFGNGENYYAVKKYHKSVSSFSWLGGTHRYDVYSFGLADGDKNIILPLSKSNKLPGFYKVYGITPKNSVDTVNIIKMDRLSAKYPCPAYLTSGKLFDASKYFKNNTYIRTNIPPFNPDIYRYHYGAQHSLINQSDRIFTIHATNLVWWYNENIIIASSMEHKKVTPPVTYQYTYGAYSITGNTIIPFNKASKDEVIKLIEGGYLSREKIRSFFNKEFNKEIISFDKNLSDKKSNKTIEKLRITIRLKTDGNTSLVKVNTDDKTIIREAKKVIAKLPLLKPAILNGKPVSVNFSFLLDYDYETQNMFANNLLDIHGDLIVNSLKKLAKLNTINRPVAKKLMEVRKKLLDDKETIRFPYFCSDSKTLLNIAIYFMNPEQGKKEMQLFLEKENKGLIYINEKVLKNYTKYLCENLDDISILIDYIKLDRNDVPDNKSRQVMKMIHEVSPKHFEKLLLSLRDYKVEIGRDLPTLELAERLKRRGY